MQHPVQRFLCAGQDENVDNKVRRRHCWVPLAFKPLAALCNAEYSGYYPIRPYQKDVNAAVVTGIEHQSN